MPQRLVLGINHTLRWHGRRERDGRKDGTRRESCQTEESRDVLGVVQEDGRMVEEETGLCNRFCTAFPAVFG